MEDKIFFIIIILLILIIFYIHYTSSNENFESEEGDLLELNSYQRCETLSKKKFMIRDIRTKLWLTYGEEDGFSKFLPGRFGITLLLPENPNDYLPIRILDDPNYYLMSTEEGDGIMVVSNPSTPFFILEIYIYNGFNIIGYLNESDEQQYLHIDDNGNISSINNPDYASKVEMLIL